jgi:hypothetical protein
MKLEQVLYEMKEVSVVFAYTYFSEWSGKELTSSLTFTIRKYYYKGDYVVTTWNYINGIETTFEETNLDGTVDRGCNDISNTDIGKEVIELTKHLF